jgi:hypothetical protein
MVARANIFSECVIDDFVEHGERIKNEELKMTMDKRQWTSLLAEALEAKID